MRIYFLSGNFLYLLLLKNLSTFVFLGFNALFVLYFCNGIHYWWNFAVVSNVVYQFVRILLKTLQNVGNQSYIKHNLLTIIHQKSKIHPELKTKKESFQTKSRNGEFQKSMFKHRDIIKRFCDFQTLSSEKSLSGKYIQIEVSLFVLSPKGNIILIYKIEIVFIWNGLAFRNFKFANYVYKTFNFL